MLAKDFIPVKPFPDFKWKWASLQCTETLNDPVILLGVLFRMRKLEKLNQGVKFSSVEFKNEMIELSNDTKDSIGVDLVGRTGERNIIRNSGQYWKALNLIPVEKNQGKIELTEFGKKVADREISQAEFATITVQTFTLPNPRIQKKEECNTWIQHGLVLYPLKLILEIECELLKRGEAYITTEELIKIIIPLSGSHAEISDYINFIEWYRNGELTLEEWPDCALGANDHRIAREFLLFLEYYGFLEKKSEGKNISEKYYICDYLVDEIKQMIAQSKNDSVIDLITTMRMHQYTDEFERKRAQVYKVSRPNQAAFRRAVIAKCERCVITNVTMPEVLEAAHIKPFKYNGEDTIHNGFAMRSDIHTLFDTGHLRISPDGKVELSNMARMDYGASIPPRIVIPDFTNLDFVRWRWENYNGL